MDSAVEEECQERLFAALREGRQRDALTLMSRGAKIDTNGLIKACERGLEEVVSVAAVNPGAICDVNSTDERKVSGFLRACCSGKQKILQLLHKQGCCLTTADCLDCNAAHYAASGGHLDVLHDLAQWGFSAFNHANERGQTPLHFASKHGHIPTMRYLLTVHCAAVSSQDQNGNTPLHLAFQGQLLIDYSELLQLLTSKGADINMPNKRGLRALHMAAEHNLVEAVECLLNYGADPTAVDKNGVSPIIVAAVSGSADVIPILQRAGANVNSKDNSGRTPLHAACTEGHLHEVKTLVNLNASQSSQDKGGNIPLQLVCQHGHLEIAKFLIESGHSDIHSQDKNGQTPVHKACKGKDSKERSQLLQYLIEKGANINLQSRYGRCPLHCTCEEGNPDAARILLEAGADVTLYDRHKQTPLHIAAFGGFSKFPTYNKVIEFLLRYNADPNRAGDQQMTAVHIAAKRGNVEALKLLIEFCGDPNARCKDGKTAVHHAVLGDPPKAEPSYEAVKFLLEKGGEPNTADDVHGNTPIHYAAIGGHSDILRLLLQSGVKELHRNKHNQLPDDLAKNASVKNILRVAKMERQYPHDETIPLPTIKLFLTGHIRAGKTALRHHLGKSMCEPRPSVHERQEKDKERTAGIEIEHLEHDAFGSVVAHDLAGHCEYSTSHSVVIDCADSSLFLIVFDITGDMLEMRKQVNYWAAFIKAGRLKGSRPHVLLVATHRDEAQAHGKDVNDLYRIYSCVRQELSVYSQVFIVTDKEFIVNALDPSSQEMDKLREGIGIYCEEIKREHPRIPTISLTLLRHLRDVTMEGNGTTMREEAAIQAVKAKSVMFAAKEDAEPGIIVLLLEYLSAMGMILKLKNWIIVDVEKVLGDVFSVLFAPDGFFTNDLRDCKKGVFPLTRISDLFEKDTDMVITILRELGLGELVLDKSAIQIPALYRDYEQKNVYWDNQEEYAQYAGWRFKSREKTDIFSPSFFPKLQVTALRQMGEKIQVWTQGFCFTEDPVQALVYMDEVKQSVDVLLRSKVTNEKACYELRKQVRIQIKDELRESSAGTEYQEFILRPHDLRRIENNNFTAYDYVEVQGAHEEKRSTITADGWFRDSIEELLFCNYLEIQDSLQADYPTDQQLDKAAGMLITDWVRVGTRIGLRKEVLDRIDVEIGRNRSQRDASFEMLYKAREGNLLQTPAQLVKVLQDCGGDLTSAAWRLAECWDIPSAPA